MIGAPSQTEKSAYKGEETASVQTAAELDVTRFSDLLASLREAKSEGSDQRRRPRAELLARATLIPLRESSQPGNLSVLIRNLSPTGLGFLHEQIMSLGEEFALVLPREGDTPAIVLCAVASWQPLARDLYSIGAQFTRILRDGGETPLPIEIAEYVLPESAIIRRRQAS